MKLAALLSVFQLVAATRKIYLNNDLNAACLSIESVGPETSLNLELESVNRTHYNNEVPVIIFDYLDLKKYTNLPNFGHFLNQTHSTDNSTEVPDSSVRFKLEHNPEFADNKGKAFSKTLVVNPSRKSKKKKSGIKSSSLTYNVESPGVYCVYLPRYMKKSELKPDPFKAELEVQNEGYMPSLTQSYSMHKQALTYTTALVIAVYYLGASAISSLILKVLLAKLSVIAVLTILEWLSITLGSDKYTIWLCKSLSLVETIVVENYQEYVVFGIYLGRGFSEKYRLLWFFKFLGAGFMGTFAYNALLIDSETIPSKVYITNALYETVFRSVLVPAGYQIHFVNKPPQLSFVANALLHVVFAVLIAFYGLVSSILLLRSTDKKLKLGVSILLHLILYKMVFKQVMNPYLDLTMHFWGYFDVAECLNRLATLYLDLQFKRRYATSIAELALVWLIWRVQPKEKKVVAKK